ncbi:MAG: ornithine carbamoyltransferase [Planctomycetota bacterium]
MPSHLLQLSDYGTDFVFEVLDVAGRLRDGLDFHRHQLEGQSMAMVFERPSLRTRVSFEVAMTQLGGHAVNLQPVEIGLDTREPAGDVGAVLSGMVDVIMARVKRHQTIDNLAATATVPVINGLSDLAHPCQTLTDLLTIRDCFSGNATGKRVCYLGDANNVLRSLVVGCGLKGLPIVACSPEGFGLTDEEVTRLCTQVPALDLTLEPDPAKAVEGADVLYTDVWASMGQEEEHAKRVAAFAGYSITQDLLAKAKPEAVVMHCLPAHRGEEIAADVMDSPRCVAFGQAHNRLHAQKGILAVLMGSWSSTST